ncbi:integrative conjugal element protein [Mycoplasma feriruminatoris]|uniref:Integrative conjugal element protein n=1 Tax=Mycoplasma feriruminatoris TaxID=1179777 RepID=A0A654IGY0_9MOLU|nr:hypothetical protein [Mycoplasma feriruminatoris]WFQ93860.1 integrative conjugal element protein [Mycoplasma feriruminatoris]VZR97366.1 hypothetical protein MF5295_00277 [Mycoplasma feriruminatoris]VZR99897.1 hypothetical protein MF5582_00319 [Mycoplasma feriruminatoris]
MSDIQIAKVYEKRYKEFSFPIAKDKNGNLIDNHGHNRPYVIFFSHNKVFYLSAKTILNNNRKSTSADKTNVIFKKDLYGKDREIAVNCSVINIMDRELFESLYIKDNILNNFQTDIEHYNIIMKKLFDVFDEIKYFEVDYIENGKVSWKKKMKVWRIKKNAKWWLKDIIGFYKMKKYLLKWF